jgi:hypothetical protein
VFVLDTSLFFIEKNQLIFVQEIFEERINIGSTGSTESTGSDGSPSVYQVNLISYVVPNCNQHVCEVNNVSILVVFGLAFMKKALRMCKGTYSPLPGTERGGATGSSQGILTVGRA